MGLGFGFGLGSPNPNPSPGPKLQRWIGRELWRNTEGRLEAEAARLALQLQSLERRQDGALARATAGGLEQARARIRVRVRVRVRGRGRLRLRLRLRLRPRPNPN